MTEQYDIKTREELQTRAANLFARLARGEVKAHTDRRMALRDAAQAHRAIVLLP